MTHTLPKLDYAYDALEPHIDAKTMEIHHTKHHQTYVDKLNAALEGQLELQKRPVEELLKNLNTIPESIRTAVRNHGGGHFNHSLFWKTLKKDVPLNGEILDEINKKFGTFEKFKEEFTKSALTLFGSGWTWLTWNGKEIEIINTPNQDNPLSQGKTPLLGLDVWEHSYYILYKWQRAEYVKNWWNIINWNQVNENLKNAK